MSTSQIPCSHCSKRYEPYNTSKGIPSKLCPSCREYQRKAEAKRKEKGRIRNYQEEAKRNLEHSWKDFCRRNSEKRGKEITISQEEFNTLVQSPCFFCGYYNEKEIVGIDRVDNEKGYVKVNCVAACKFCNRAKHIFHPFFFIEKVKIINKYKNGLLLDSERDTFYSFWKEYLHKSPVPYLYMKRNTEEKRKLPFHITKEQYEELIYKPCYLCGLRNRHGNGLDRVDNTKREYSIEYVLPCCSTCNMMKAHFGKDEFLAGIQKIANYFKEIPDDWNSIPRGGFQMGGAKTDIKNPEKEKEQQWRSKTIYKAVKADSLVEFKQKVLEQTNWSEEIFEKETQSLFEKIKNEPFENVEKSLQELVTKIRYTRLGRKKI